MARNNSSRRAAETQKTVAALLSSSDFNLATETLEIALEGFDEERFDLWRVVRQG